MTRPLIFFGSDQYSAVVLSALLKPKTYNLIAIVTDRGKPKDRDQKVEPGPVEKLARERDIKVLYYPDKKEDLGNFVDLLKTETNKLKPAGLCASFDHLLPAGIIELFAGELYNLHPSLLPQYRNVSPVQYALALGDSETGITLFRLSAGIDNGEIIAQASETIAPDDTTPTLTPRLFQKGAELFLNYDPTSHQNVVQTRKRADVQSTNLIFTHRLTRDSGCLEWPVFQKLLAGESVRVEDTQNEILRLRLSRESLARTLLDRNARLQAEQGSAAAERRALMVPPALNDLFRALTPWPGVWTMAETKKGSLRITLKPCTCHVPCAMYHVLIAGKPNAIPWSDFTKHYLHA